MSQIFPSNTTQAALRRSDPERSVVVRYEQRVEPLRVLRGCLLERSVVEAERRAWHLRTRSSSSSLDFEDEQMEPQMELVDIVCKAVVRRGMIVPALMALEMSRPLNFVASQAMHFFRPIVSVVLDGPSIAEFATFLEHRGSVEYLCQRLEYWDRVGPDAEDPDSTSEPQDHTPDDEPRP